jgi:hypothetical protein
MNTIQLTILGMLSGAALAGAEPSVRSHADIDRLAWLAGHWCLEKDGQFIEEYWLPPRGGRIVAMGRTTVNGEARSFEFLRIEMRGESVVFVAQPEGQPPVSFAMTASGGQWARFENPEHDFPQVVEYRRTPAGLHAEISGPGQGGDRVIGFAYSRCAGG